MNLALFDWNLNNSHNIQYGIDVIRHNFKPGLKIVNEFDGIIEPGDILSKQDLQDSLSRISENGFEFNVYAEDKFIINPKIE